MNKTVKGSLAGAAGIALLMGGFGSYATWSDSSTQSGDSITAGNMDVQANAISWTDNANPANTLGNSNDWNLKMVPGDSVTRTQTFSFTGAGKNLKGAIKFTPGTASVSDTAHPATSNDSFTINVSVAGLSHLTANPAGNCWTFATKDGDLPETATTTVTYTLTADNQDLQDATATLTDSSFSIVQNDTCPA